MSSLAASSPFGLNFTKLSKGICVILGVGFIVQYAAPTSRQYLCLVAGRFIPCVWNVFTAGLIETSLVQLIFSILSILLLARIIEPIWGSKEFLKFLAIVNLGTGVLTLAVLYICFVINSFKERAGKVLYMEVSGFHGIVAACLVAVKQLIPDTEVTLLRIIRFQAKHLAGLYVLISVLTGISFHSILITVPSVVSSTVLSWIYLRYFQTKPGLNLRGDPGDDFRLATFFPEFLQPAIDRVASIFSRGQTETGESKSPINLPSSGLPGSETTEAARRRERGAKVLEERLTAAGSKPQNDAQKSDIESGEISESRPNNGAK